MKTWPKCESQRAQLTARRRRPQLKSQSTEMLPSAKAAVKLGQPVRESYFASDAKTAVPHAAQR